MSDNSSDLFTLLQRMMQSGMTLPNLKQMPTPGYNAQNIQGGSPQSLFDDIKKFKDGVASGVSLGGGKSLFGPSGASGTVAGGDPNVTPTLDDNGMPVEDAKEDDSKSLFTPKNMADESLQKPAPFSAYDPSQATSSQPGGSGSFSGKGGSMAQGASSGSSGKGGGAAAAM